MQNEKAKGVGIKKLFQTEKVSWLLQDNLLLGDGMYLKADLTHYC